MLLKLKRCECHHEIICINNARARQYTTTMEGRKPTLCGTRHSGFEGWKNERKFGVGLQVVMEPFCAPRIRCAFGDVRRETRTLEGSTIVVDIVFTRATESVR